MDINEMALWMIAVHNRKVVVEAKRGVETEESGFYDSWWISLYLANNRLWDYAINNYDHLIKKY